MQPQRDLYIDFLRFIGISLIILAHVKLRQESLNSGASTSR